MAIAIRAYQPEDVPALVEIWNEVVEQGIAFPQKAPLTNQIGAAFLQSNHAPQRLMIQKPQRSWVCISCTRTMLDGADISAMPAMR